VVLTHSNDDSEKPFLDEEQTLLDLLASNMAQVIAREKIMNEISMKNVALQELNAEKDKILSIIAHDLRSPLSTIIGLSELLENKYNSIESRKGLIMVQGISKTSNRLYQLLENLLDWARLKRGKIDFIPKVNNLREIATTSVGIYEDQISIKQLNLTIEIDSALTVFADANMVQTIFRNLISNAIKFSNRNGQITISASKADSNFVQVSIADSGVGMDSVVLDSLFQISNEVGRPGTEDEPSSGFGLPLCKELVEKNGGVIWAESQEGFGSRLRFTLPANSINN
jgi:signal transduction histidine kinase